MTWAHCNDNLKPIKIRQVEEMSNIFDRKSKDYTFFSEFFFSYFQCTRELHKWENIW